MDKFSLAVVTANLKNNYKELSIEQLLVYVNEVIGSDLPFEDKVAFTGKIEKSLQSVPRSAEDSALVIKLAKALGSYDYSDIREITNE
jgi:hypothetical protein